MKTAWKDPVVEEIRKNWEEYAAQFDFDLERVFEDLQRMDREDPDPGVSFSQEDSEEVPRPRRRSHG